MHLLAYKEYPYGSNGEIIWQAGNNNSTVGRWDVGEDSGFDGSWSSFPGNNGGGSPTDPILSTNYDLMQYSLDHISLVKMNNMATKIMEHYNLNIPYTEFWNNLSQSGALELILANIGTWNNSMTFNDINEINIFIDEYKELLFLVDIGYSLDNTNSLNTPAYIWLVGHNPQFFFIKNNYNTSQDDEFARWSIEFLMQHPNTTQAQFENWFMGEVEGPDLGFDEAFWNNPANNFPHQDLPSWAYFDDAYPRINGRDMTRDEIVNLVGGQVKVIADQYNIGMVCALKLSRALNYTGVVSIPNIPSTGDYPGTVQGGDGLYYFMNAEAMNRWMRKTFGCANPNTSIGEYFNPEAIHWADADLDKNEKDVLNYVKSNHINGIYSAVARKDQFNASGHCDLIKEDGTCVRSCYFQQASSFKWIDIWKLH